MLKRIILVSLIFLVGIKSVHAEADILVPTQHALTEDEQMEQQKLVAFDTLVAKKVQEHKNAADATPEAIHLAIGAFLPSATFFGLLYAFEDQFRALSDLGIITATTVGIVPIVYIAYVTSEAYIKKVERQLEKHYISDALDDVVRFYTQFPEQLPIAHKKPLEALIAYYKTFDSIPFGLKFKHKLDKVNILLKTWKKMLAKATV